MLLNYKIRIYNPKTIFWMLCRLCLFFVRKYRKLVALPRWYPRQGRDTTEISIGKMTGIETYFVQRKGTCFNGMVFPTNLMVPKWELI